MKELIEIIFFNLEIIVSISFETEALFQFWKLWWDIPALFNVSKSQIDLRVQYIEIFWKGILVKW